MAKLWEGIQNIFAPVVGFFTGIWESIKDKYYDIKYRDIRKMLSD